MHGSPKAHERKAGQGSSAAWEQNRASRRSPQEFLAVRYNTSRIEEVLPFIFAVLSSSSWLIEYVNALRNAAQEADAWLSGVSPFAQLTEWQLEILRKKVHEDGVRVHNASGNALIAFDKIQT